MKIQWNPSVGHDDNMPIVPDHCGCGSPIITAYRLADGEFVCMSCHRKGK